MYTVVVDIIQPHALTTDTHEWAALIIKHCTHSMTVKCQSIHNNHLMLNSKHKHDFGDERFQSISGTDETRDW